MLLFTLFEKMVYATLCVPQSVPLVMELHTSRLAKAMVIVTC